MVLDNVETGCRSVGCKNVGSFFARYVNYGCQYYISEHNALEVEKISEPFTFIVPSECPEKILFLK